jgi:hypothetical protein
VAPPDRGRRLEGAGRGTGPGVHRAEPTPDVGLRAEVAAIPRGQRRDGPGVRVVAAGAAVDDDPRHPTARGRAAAARERRAPPRPRWRRDRAVAARAQGRLARERRRVVPQPAPTRRAGAPDRGAAAADRPERARAGGLPPGRARPHQSGHRRAARAEPEVGRDLRPTTRSPPPSRAGGRSSGTSPSATSASGPISCACTR